MKIQLSFLIAFAVICAGSTSVDASTSFYGYDYHYNLKKNRDYHKIMHGYAPYYFSDSARSRYSYTAEEKGHYIDGRTDKEWPFSEKAYELSETWSDDSDGVLMSVPSDEYVSKLSKEVNQAFALAKQKKVTPRVNEMRDIDQVIQRHKWTFESLIMRKAVKEGRSEVKADTIDYDRLFQVK